MGIAENQILFNNKWVLSLLFFLRFFFFLEVDRILKSLLNLLQCCLHSLMLWFFDYKACGDLSSPPRG